MEEFELKYLYITLNFSQAELKSVLNPFFDFYPKPKAKKLVQILDREGPLEKKKCRIPRFTTGAESSILEFHEDKGAGK